jgi:hypothetical protein
MRPSGPREKCKQAQASQVDEKDWPPMNADERRLKTNQLPALICVYRRLALGFSASCSVCSGWEQFS